MEPELIKIVHKLQELEDRYGVLVKVELFTDSTGTLMYLTDTKNVEWKTGFYFSGMKLFEEGLQEFEEFLAG
jgi:hypothetical protein